MPSTAAPVPAPEPTPAAAPTVTAADYRAAQVAEWNTYRANKSIVIDGANAFNAGDPVPTSHVERGVVSTVDVDLIQKG